jgi:hypothetical protein
LTDVDETIPTAALSITPQVPTVTAGTGTVNSVPVASLTITPNTFGFQKYPLFEVLDSNGNRIDIINFGNLEAGMESDPQVIVLVNNSGGSVDVTLTAAIGDEGTLTETATSTYLSDDDADYVLTTDTYTVPANSSLPVYIKWRPPSTSRPGPKTWMINTIDDTITPLSGWSYAGSILIDGCHDGALTDYQVEVEVDYSEDVMRSDFGDIRFTLPDETPLSYHLKSYTTSDSAVFVVKIPSIPAKPSDTTILIHSGKSDATTTSSPSDVYLFFDDASGTYSDKWNNITGTGSYTEVDGEQAISLNNSSTVIRTKTFQATAPFKIDARVYSTAYVTAIQYCQDTTPVVNERYSARIDVRSGLGEKILKGSSTISNDVDQFGTASQWADCTLTLDGVGNHTWTVEDSATPAVAVDTTYTTGYLALIHDSSGTGAVAMLAVSNSTQHPPLVGEVVWNSDYTLNLTGGVVYTVPDLPELDLQNQYIVNVGGVGYE